MTKTLIVVDMLKDFIDEDGKLYCGPTATAIVPAVKAKIKEYMENGWNIIFLCDAHDEDDLEFNRFPEHAVDGTDGAEIIDEFNDAAYLYNRSHRVFKTRYSGFYGTELNDLLVSLMPDVVEVVGVCTSICVMDTVGGLANRDYKIEVPVNAVADFDPDAHNAALTRMENLYGAKFI